MQRASASISLLDSDPLWFQRAVFYEIQPHSFYDTNADGVGDIRGVIEKLEYLEWLGIDAVWITPFYASPQRDGGYDITDYFGVHPKFGSLDDIADLIYELHRRKMRVLVDLVLNHTSDEHPWFVESRQDKTNPKADWYVWSDDPSQLAMVKNVFADLEESIWQWDEVRQQYYLHRFYHFQPDLNYDNPEVQEAMLNVVRFWLEMGVDGFRLDAVTRLYEREDSASDGLPETHAYLKRVRAEVEAHRHGVILLAEADGSPQDVLEYFGDGLDECHMNLHFPVMPQLFYSLAVGNGDPLRHVIAETPTISGRTQWGTFLRNHDELTCAYLPELQRREMFEFFAPDGQNIVHNGIAKRLFSLLGNNRVKAELLYALLLSLPGSPFLYYGDEIGMGSDPSLFDRDPVRTPMQWNDLDNGGFSTADASELFLPANTSRDFGYKEINVESQREDQSSFLSWVRAAIGFRKRHPQFGSGRVHLLDGGCAEILVFARLFSALPVVCFHNMSAVTQRASVSIAGAERLHDQMAHDAIIELHPSRIDVELGPYGYCWLAPAGF